MKPKRVVVSKGLQQSPRNKDTSWRNREEIIAALSAMLCLNPRMPHDYWRGICFGLVSKDLTTEAKTGEPCYIGAPIFIVWSYQAPDVVTQKTPEQQVEDVRKSQFSGERVTISTLFGMANGTQLTRGIPRLCRCSAGEVAKV